MTYIPSAPHWRTYHHDWRTAHVVNSTRGSVLARESGCPWCDNDFHLSAPTKPGKTDNAWINAHGAPEDYWLARGDRFEDHTAAELFAIMRHGTHLRNMRQTLADNHHNGVNTEVEVKDVHPWAKPAILDAAFARLAAHAEAVYGADWQRHVVVKVLTNLAGGEGYALKILAHAHAHGIPTMLLVRGRCRFKKYEGHTEIDYVRGSLVTR